MSVESNVEGAFWQVMAPMGRDADRMLESNWTDRQHGE